MAIPGIKRFHIDVFWDNEYQNLAYINEKFNDEASLDKWINLGFRSKFTGDMCDMRSVQPSWNHKFIKLFKDLGWQNIGTSYYRMMPGTVLPTHQDLYIKYVELFDLHGREQDIRRAVVFLENWQSGHYFEAAGQPWTEWQAGDTVQWSYDTPHMAANLGSVPRYTLQITGHI